MLASLPESNHGLREGTTREHLRELATALTDVQAAEELEESRQAFFKRARAHELNSPAGLRRGGRL